VPYQPEKYSNPVRRSIAGHAGRYPVSRLSEIDRLSAEQREQEKNARAAAAHEPVYYLQVAVLSDADAAAALLTELIDEGHEGTLVSTQSAGSVFYEVQLGPFASIADAEEMGRAVKRVHPVSPSVVVVAPPEDEPSPQETQEQEP